MKVAVWTVFILTLLILFLNLSLLHSVIVGADLFFLLYFLDRFGRKFVFLEILAFIALTQWLLAPMLAYIVGGVMKVSPDVYFHYALPATFTYLFFVTLPLWRQKVWDQRINTIVESLVERYKYGHRTAIILVIVGTCIWIVQTVVPPAFRMLFYLLSHLLLVGISLLLFTRYRWKWIWFGGALMVLIFTTLLNGMIGTAFLWLLALSVLYTTRYPLKVSFPVKLALFLCIIWFLAVMQTSKTQYRMETWDINRSETSSRQSRNINQDPGLLASLVWENMRDFKGLTSTPNLIQMANRLNQGMLVTFAMDYVPRRRDFGLGEVTLGNTFSAFIPRMVWPNKPIVGQQEYFQKFTGIKLGKYTSATLGPIGDAYADFGQYGALFLALFGLIISGTYTRFIKSSLIRPAYFLWFMMIFLSTLLVSEISTAGYLNSLFKMILYIIGIRFVLNTCFRLDL